MASWERPRTVAVDWAADVGGSLASYDRPGETLRRREWRRWVAAASTVLGQRLPARSKMLPTRPLRFAEEPVALLASYRWPTPRR